LALSPGHAIDQIARQRLSTVYMPGHKITMLPDHVVQSYTLQEGRDCPAVSLYLRVHESSLEVLGSETRLENVFIAANLRHDQLDDVVTEAWLDTPEPLPGMGSASLPMPHSHLAFLYRLAQQRKAQRELVRGKPETFNRPDYNFRIGTPKGQAPNGDEIVEISQRHRGAPLDLIVAEAMILANSTWGQWLADLSVPAIYRSQASLLPGIKVRMGTKALPHAGIGVPCYAWSTSPLRRYTDLVNQWQIIACIKHGTTAALVAPFKAKDVDLFSIISAFEAAYSSYNGYQSSMERFWTLQYLQQNAIREVTATVFKSFEGEPPIARVDNLPLVLPVIGSGSLARGTRVLLRISAVDTISLEVHGLFVEVLEEMVNATNDNTAQAHQEDDDESPAGPLTIAVDIEEAPSPEAG
jgi:exoribonuclease-2